jgi:hypothetical protein
VFSSADGVGHKGTRRSCKFLSIKPKKIHIESEHYGNSACCAPGASYTKARKKRLKKGRPAERSTCTMHG